MRQLVQLQENYAKFQDLDAEILAVFREEEKGTEGLKLSQERVRASFPFLWDAEAKQTAAYSQQGFDTYLIDKRGIIRDRLKGIKVRRPTAEQILNALQKVSAVDGASP